MGIIRCCSAIPYGATKFLGNFSILTHHLNIAQQLGPEMGESTLSEMMFGFICFLPEYIALYLLSYKSEDLWTQTEQFRPGDNQSGV